MGHAMRISGLSPRVRGNRHGVDPGAGCHGSIPACAGEPLWTFRISSSPSVYPRVCGGTSRRCSRRLALRGLSPRVRGNRHSRIECMSSVGSIPACAGEPLKVWEGSFTLTVYPRVCGGTEAGRHESPGRPGLSPRVRGNRWHCHSCQLERGSIPACAGEPMDGSAFIVGRTVYPRVCGGTGDVPFLELCREGLSPRVRGNPSGPGLRPGSAGSIPACAGEPVNCKLGVRVLTVYPRVCGGTQTPVW